MKPDEFWELTLHELDIYVTETLSRQKQRDTTLAWMSGALLRTDTKKYPKLDDLLGKRKKPQSGAEMVAMLKGIGGK